MDAGERNCPRPSQDSSITLTIACDGCRGNREFNVWKIGVVLADTAIQTLRFRCHRCGVYPNALRIGRRTSSTGDLIMMIPLRPRAWDEGHEEAQRIALDRAQRAFEARRKAALDVLGSTRVPDKSPVNYRCSESWL